MADRVEALVVKGEHDVGTHARGATTSMIGATAGARRSTGKGGPPAGGARGG
jgi:hypothetical protein